MAQSLSKSPVGFPINSTVAYKDILGLCEGILHSTTKVKEDGKIIVRISVKGLGKEQRKLLKEIPAINPGSETSILYLFDPSQIALSGNQNGRQTQGKTSRRSKQ